MTRAKISEYSATAGDNTDVNGVNIAEGCPPSGINDAIREVMGALKRFETGSDGDSLLVGGQLTVTGTTTTSPAIVAAGDTNTGIFFPAADTIAFAEGGVEAMRITSAGEVLVGGTTSVAVSGGGPGNLTLQRARTGTYQPTLNIFADDTSIGSGDVLGLIKWFGNDTTSNTPTNLAYISAVASGTHAAGDNPTDIVFGTTPDGSETVAEVARFTESKYLRMASGTGGIQFGGDTAAANALDDYEEGTFTPKFADASSGGNESSTTLFAKYTKIGNVVYYVISAGNLSTAGLTSGNVAYITGFPFSNNSGFNAYAMPWTDSLNYDGYPMFQLAANQTWGNFKNCRDAATDTDILVSAFTSGVSDFYINGFYYVS